MSTRNFEWTSQPTAQPGLLCSSSHSQIQTALMKSSAPAQIRLMMQSHGTKLNNPSFTLSSLGSRCLLFTSVIETHTWAQWSCCQRKSPWKLWQSHCFRTISFYDATTSQGATSATSCTSSGVPVDSSESSASWAATTHSELWGAWETCSFCT